MSDSSSAPMPDPQPPRPTSGPAPRWGEYAPVPVAPAPGPGAPSGSQAAAQGAVPNPTNAHPGAQAGQRAGVRTPRKWDRILTIVLLVFATYTVITGLFTYSDLPAALDQVYAIQGIGRFESIDAARTIGLTLNALQLSVYVLTVWLSYRMLKQNRITFWVPLTAGVIVTLVTSVLLVMLVIGDPAFREYAASMG
jgi:hypothetical protein